MFPPETRYKSREIKYVYSGDTSCSLIEKKIISAQKHEQIFLGTKFVYLLCGVTGMRFFSTSMSKGVMKALHIYEKISNKFSIFHNK
jgi:hypothetical protein